MMPKPRRCAPSCATTTLLAASTMLRKTRGAVQLQPSPCSIRSRDNRAIVGASARVANRRVRLVIMTRVRLLDGHRVGHALHGRVQAARSAQVELECDSAGRFGL